MTPTRCFHATIAITFAGAIAAGITGPYGRADLIYFRNGGDAQVPAAIEANRVVLAMPDGKVELSREIIRKLVPGFWPATSGRAATARTGQRLRCAVRKPSGGPSRTV